MNISWSSNDSLTPAVGTAKPILIPVFGPHPLHVPCHLFAHEPRGARVSSGSSASLRPLGTIFSPRTRNSNLSLGKTVKEVSVRDWWCGLGLKRRGGPR